MALTILTPVYVPIMSKKGKVSELNLNLKSCLNVSISYVSVFGSRGRLFHRKPAGNLLFFRPKVSLPKAPFVKNVFYFASFFLFYSLKYRETGTGRIHHIYLNITLASVIIIIIL